MQRCLRTMLLGLLALACAFAGGCSKGSPQPRGRGAGRDRQQRVSEAGRGGRAREARRAQLPTPAPAPTPQPSLAGHFEGGRLSLSYPGEWSQYEAESFARMKEYLKSQMGADLLLIVTAPGDACMLQIAKQPNDKSFEGLFKDKQEFAAQVSREGIDIAGNHYVSYSVDKTKLPGDIPAVLSHAERDNGQTGVSYQFIFRGSEYNLNFIYPTGAAAAEGAKLRKEIMATLAMK